MKKTLSTMMTAGALVLAAQQSQATLIGPGEAVTPVNTGVGPTSVLLASKVDGFTIVASGITGTVTSKVYAEDPAAGDSTDGPNELSGLIFTYQISLATSLPGHALG